MKRALLIVCWIAFALVLAAAIIANMPPRSWMLGILEVAWVAWLYVWVREGWRKLL